MINKSLSEKLDIVRGTASFIVLLAHTSQWFLRPVVDQNFLVNRGFSYLAHFSVLIFFALSGFVITNSLVENYRRNGYINSGSFVFSRLARIVPPGFAACAFSLTVALIIIGFGFHGSESFRLDTDHYVAREKITILPQNVIASFLFSNGILKGTGPIVTNGPLWTLSLEFWAYFIALVAASCIYNLGKNDPEKRSLSVTLFVCLLIILAFIYTRPFYMMQYFFYWLIGSALFLRKQYPVLVNSFIGLIFFSAAVSLGWSYLGNIPIKLNIIIGTGLAGLLAIPVKASILILLTLFLPVVGIFSPAKVLSRSSYTLYVFHFPTLCLLFSLFHERFVQWNTVERGLFCITTVVFITLGCHYLAKFLEDKHRWEARQFKLKNSVVSLLKKASI